MKKHNKLSLLSQLSLGSLVAVVGIGTIATFPNSSDNTPIALQPAIAQTNSPLAKQLQGKPTVVKIYAQWCPACEKLKPIMSSLQQQYGNDATFIILDVTDRTTTQAAEAKAKELGLENFFNTYKSQTATIAVINPSNGQVLKQYRKNFNPQDYVNAINMAIAQVSR